MGNIRLGKNQVFLTGLMRAGQEVDFVTFFQAERALNPVEPSSRTKKCKINSLGKKDSPSPTKQREESKQYSPSGGCWSV